jgi:hypothetical protein
MKLKRIVVSTLVLLALAAIVCAEESHVPSGRATPDARVCVARCASEQAACSQQCALAWLSNTFTDDEYRACVEHCVDDYMSCESACPSGG